MPMQRAHAAAMEIERKYCVASNCWLWYERPTVTLSELAIMCHHEPSCLPER